MDAETYDELVRALRERSTGKAHGSIGWICAKLERDAADAIEALLARVEAGRLSLAEVEEQRIEARARVAELERENEMLRDKAGRNQA